MKARSNIFVFLCIACLCASTTHGDEETTTNVWATELIDFSCTNTSVSKALALLTQKSSLPINSIIDNTDEPHVTVSQAKSRLGDLIQEILKPMTNYGFALKKGTILVSPTGLLEDKSNPLNRPIPEFYATYYLLNMGRPPLPHERTDLHVCIFSNRAPNISTPMATFLNPPPPTVKTFPVTRRFEGQTMLEILTSISSEWRESWACGRMQPKYIHWFNNGQRKAGIPVNEMVWPDENAPCYSVGWGWAGASHGEYAFVYGTPYSGGVTVEEAEQQEAKERDREAKFRQSLELRPYFDTIHELVKRGSMNREPSPAQIQVDFKTTEVSNHTAAVMLSLTITNTTANEVRIPNPYLGVLQQAFWDVRVDNFQYQIALPSTGTAPEPKELVLAPNSASTRVMDILGAKMVLDRFWTDSSYEETYTKLSSPGRYWAVVFLYFKGEDGHDHCVMPPPQFDRPEFEIK